MKRTFNLLANFDRGSYRSFGQVNCSPNDGLVKAGSVMSLSRDSATGPSL